jgi:N-acetylglucosamine-6-phosphate deacetylase
MGGLQAEVLPEGYATTGEGLAGSIIPLVEAVRVAVRQAGIPLATAVAMASSTPAGVIGLAGRKGSLVEGADADLLVLGPELEVRAVYRGGHQVAEAAGRSVR